jgi:hypothetical protein
MVMFCDACGTRFENGDIQPNTRLCFVCGNALPQWLIDAAVNPRQYAVDDLPTTEVSTLTSTETMSEPSSIPESIRVLSASDNTDSEPPSRATSPAAPELSLDITTYDLPPPFPVPSRYNQPFLRPKVIAKILGGGMQVTYPVSRSREFPMYACPRMDYNPTVPAIHGHHGILITKPMPREFVFPRKRGLNHSLRRTLLCS